jgi:Polysaccharide lyase
LALMGATWLAPLTAVHAQTTVNYTFEDGVVRGDPTSMKVPPKIVTENGNKYMRITGSAGDHDSIPAKYPDKNRSTVTMTSGYSSMPVLSDANRRQTYSADIRFHDDTGSDGYVFELFQAQEGGPDGGYGTHDGQGPAARFIVKKGRVFFETRYQNETKVDQYDLGVSATSWHTYTLKAVWSHSASVGRFDVYVDGKLKKTITGRDVNVGPQSNRLPMMKLGLYGDYATGVIDVDNVKAGPSGSSSPAPSVALSGPTNVLLVSGQ